MTITDERPARAPRVAHVHPVKSPAMKDLLKLEALSAKIAADEAQMAKDKTERNKLAIAARKDGYPWARLEAATGMTRQSLREATMRANGGVLPAPRQRG